MKVKLSKIKKSIEFRKFINSKQPSEVALKTSAEIIYSTDACKAFEPCGLSTWDFLSSLDSDCTYCKEIPTKFNTFIDKSLYYGCKKEPKIPENVLIVDAKELLYDIKFRSNVLKAGTSIDVIVDCDFGDTNFGAEMKEFIFYSASVFQWVEDELYKNSENV